MSVLLGWPYRKAITLSRASGAVSNYQMKLFVGESTIAASDTFTSSTAQDFKSGGDGVKQYGWYAINTANATSMDANNTAAGKARIVNSAVNSGIDGISMTAPMIYKIISGNFDVEFNFDTTANQTYEQAGAMIFNTSNINLHTYLTDYWGTALTAAARSSTGANPEATLGTDTASAPHFYRIVRSGNLFTFYRKINVGDAWTTHFSQTRSDLGDSIGVGIYSATNNTANSLTTDVLSFTVNVNEPTVDCGGLCKSDFSDLRFTTSDGVTLLDYWIELISGTTPNQVATVWIEFDSIGTGATTFYMYYGNAGASAVSSGTNTFIAFDDFERGADGDATGGDWTLINTCQISTAQKYGGTRGNKLVGAATTASCTLPVTASVDIAINMRIYKPDAGAMGARICDGATYPFWRWHTDEKIEYYNGAAWVDSGSTPAAAVWHQIEMYNMNYTSDVFSLSLDGTEILNGVAMRPLADITANALRVDERVSTNGIDAWFDNVFVRNWRATGPAWGSWGAKEYLRWSPFPFPNLS